MATTKLNKTPDTVADTGWLALMQPLQQQGAVALLGPECRIDKIYLVSAGNLVQRFSLLRPILPIRLLTKLRRRLPQPTGKSPAKTFSVLITGVQRQFGDRGLPVSQRWLPVAVSITADNSAVASHNKTETAGADARRNNRCGRLIRPVTKAHRRFLSAGVNGAAALKMVLTSARSVSK